MAGLSNSQTSTASTRLIVLAFIAFISLGLPDALLGVAWPEAPGEQARESIQSRFHQPFDHLGMLLVGGMVGYLTSSFSAGTIVRAIGVGRLLLASSLVVLLSLTMMTFSPWWPGVVLASVVGGLGAGAIDAGINAFAASKFSTRVVNWLHAFWGVGATSGPALMTAVLANGYSYRWGYGLVAIAIAVLSILFYRTLNLWELKDDSATEAEPDHATLGETLRRPFVWLHTSMFFIYCGIENTAGQLLFSVLTKSRGVSVAMAGTTVACYWGALTVGRIVFGQMASTFQPIHVLRFATCLAPVAAILIRLAPNPAISILGSVLLGFSLAPIFPTFISLTPQRVGQRFASQAVGLQVSVASIGIAAFPSVVAALTDEYGYEFVTLYLVVATFALLALHELVQCIVARRQSSALSGPDGNPLS